MISSFRWYGESDPVSLKYISQIPGMRSVVSAVYDVKPGEVWPEESLAKMKADSRQTASCSTLSSLFLFPRTSSSAAVT